ncbi:exopolysaccharide biosynthesis protein [Roseospira navarrensis]|uniref:Exopolysaccharide biosynthesis protein n=1 Tax=Roseospira navarrensis TaxID=140058 RepID=A0A7X1ZC73_9PROT|nr:exopolysaccharide biosynthesis protein [Roseospira navarrensis]MQX35861.1 hypothetical protein [Roseospira navarrensis]
MPQSVNGVFDALEDSAAQKDTVSVDTLLSALGRRTYGPIVFAIGLVMLSPINWIPGAGILLATVLTLMLAQSLIRTGPPWLPRRLADAAVDGDKAVGAIRKIRPWLERLALISRPRLRDLTQGPWRVAAILVIIATALSMYPLAIIPGGVGPPSLAITVFGLALTVEDGLLMMVALAVAGVAFGLAGWAVL